MTKGIRLTGLVVCGYLYWVESACADAVVDWNNIAVQAVLTAGSARPGATGFLDLAMVHVAAHDAVEAIDKRFRPYHFSSPSCFGSTAAAAARAVHDVLVARFPEQASSLDLTYHTFLTTNRLAETDPGVKVGQAAAADIIALRARDGSFPNPLPEPFVGGTEPGMWRPTMSYLPGPPPSDAPMLVPWLADVAPFTLTGPTQFRAEQPPALTSPQYTRAYNEVKALGSLFSTTRLSEQTDLAYFWAANYIVVWNQALRDIATAHINNLDESARLFALANLAMTDSAITAWDTKRHYVFWRPITAIQNGDSDGNPKTEGDPDWQPLINTPNYPDYTSGANNVTGAATRMLALFFGTNEMVFSVTTTNPVAVQQTRTFSRFSDAAREVVAARILEGIHFRFADTVARRQGRDVAKWTFQHFLRPVHGSEHDHVADDAEHNDPER